MTAVLIWVGVLGLAGVIWKWRRAEIEAAVAKDGETAAHHARTVALAAKDRADSEGRRAREAVEKMTAAEMELYMQQGQQEAGRKILEQAAAFHEGFVAERSSDPEVMGSACTAWSKLGWIREELGQRGAAMQRSAELADQLLSMAPDNDQRMMRRALAEQFGGVSFNSPIASTNRRDHMQLRSRSGGGSGSVRRKRTNGRCDLRIPS